MRKGNILVESIIFLILSFFMFLLVFNGIERLWQRQRIIEKNSEKLSWMLSLSNVIQTGKNIPTRLKKYLGASFSDEKHDHFQTQASRQSSKWKFDDTTVGGNDRVQRGHHYDF